MKYRAEIDGLRALAILPVILFHAGIDQFSGGFVGVDVFFVISGYLITNILIEDFENKRFSIVDFYERRARRILPALFFVMIVCMPFAWIWMLEIQMKDFSQSLVAVSLFASNILFWLESTYFYFGAAAEEKPLIHTWSLAVEEQYYVFFPLLLMLVWRFGKTKVFWIIVLLAATSILLSEWGWRNNPNANFYIAPTRAWEIFAGSIAAFMVQKKGVQKNNLLAILGLGAIISSIIFYDKNTPIPSLYGLVPVLGVMMLILFADKETIVAKILSTKLFVGVGLISYSAYLWHQPLFAFARIRLPEDPSSVLMLILSATSIVLAYFTWRYVETPFRNKERASRFFFLGMSFAGLILFMSFGIFGHFNEGYSNRLSAKSIDFQNRLYNQITEFEYDIRAKRAFSNDGRKKILIFGDSYAKDFLEGLVIIFGDEINGFDILMRRTPRRCKNVLADTKNLVEYLHPKDTHCYGQIERIGNPNWEPLIADADLVVVRSYWDVLPTLEMPRTYDYLDSINPQRVIFLGTQIFGKNNPFNNLVGIENSYPNMEGHGVTNIKPYSRINEEITTYDLIKKAVHLMKGRNYFDIFEFFCSKEKCRITDENGYPLTNDFAHLTSDGEIVMFKLLFDDLRFRKIWGNAIGVFPQMN